MKKLYSVFMLMLALAACSSPGDRLKVDVSDIGMPETVIRRYDRDLFRLNTTDLKNELEQLKSQYPFFLKTNLDSMKILAMRDYLENERNKAFFRASDSVFRDMSEVSSGLTDAFRHMAYYFKGFKAPRVYSYISGGDYQYPVQFADSVLLIAIDCYLGKGCYLYKDDQLPLYRERRADRVYIVSDAMGAIFSAVCPSDFPGNTLLDQMIQAGKRILFIDAMMPETSGFVKMGYTKEQYEWAAKNEEHVWAAIIGNNLLYNTSGQTMRTFLSDGPFTAEFSKESPPRLGEYIGWRILLQYMERNPKVSLLEILKERDGQKLLTGSAYKPQK